MTRIAAPRLLPITIFALAGVLALRSVELARVGLLLAAGTTVVPAAQAAVEPPASAPSPDATPAGPAPSPASSPVGGPSPSLVPQAKPDEPPPVSDSERAVLLELRQRRQELDARARTLETRESVLAAAEQKLGARVTELQTLQRSLETLEAARQQRDDANWQGLVKLYEAMKPRDAAAIFNDLDQPVLLQVVDRMKEAKAAPILAAMQPDKARAVTAQLAALRPLGAPRPPPPRAASNFPGAKFEGQRPW